MERFLESPGKRIFETWKTLEIGLCKFWKKTFECLYKPCYIYTLLGNVLENNFGVLESPGIVVTLSYIYLKSLIV